VLDDKELQRGFSSNPKYGDLVSSVAGDPVGVHVKTAIKQAATRAESEALLLFMCLYAGFKAVVCIRNAERGPRSSLIRLFGRPAPGVSC
jgi:hypothetical protein